MRGPRNASIEVVVLALVLWIACFLVVGIVILKG